MKVWTDGYRVVYLNADGLHVIEGENTSSYEDFGLIGDAESGVLAVAPDGEELWTQTSKGRAARITFGKKKVDERDWDLLAATFHGRSLLACGRKAGGAQPRIFFFDPQADDGDGETAVTVPRPKAVSWPGVIWDEGDEPWVKTNFRKDGSSDVSNAYTFSTNRFGTVLTDASTGTVALMRHEKQEFEFALRVPVDAKTFLYGEATADGVLVSLSSNGEASALLHFDKKGKVRAYRAFWSLGPALVLGRDLVVTPASEGYGEGDLCFRIMNISHMEERQTITLDFDAAPESLAGFGRRTEFVLGTHDRLFRGVRGVAEWELESITWQKTRKPKKAVEEAEAQPTQGDVPLSNREPEVGFPAGRKPVKWTGKKGDTTRIALDVRSAGKPGRGLRIWLSGDAVKKGIVVPKSAHSEGVEAPFVEDARKFMAELDVELPAGVVYPWQSKPKDKESAEAALDESHVILEFELDAEAKGSELLTVEVATEGQSAPIKWMRPVTVR